MNTQQKLDALDETLYLTPEEWGQLTIMDAEEIDKTVKALRRMWPDNPPVADQSHPLTRVLRLVDGDSVCGVYRFREDDWYIVVELSPLSDGSPWYEVATEQETVGECVSEVLTDDLAAMMGISRYTDATALQDIADWLEEGEYTPDGIVLIDELIDEYTNG